jgi:transposase
MISEEMVFGSSELFDVVAVQHADEQVILSVQSRKTQAVCPHCRVNSGKLHSYYHRKIKDLPAFDNKVRLVVKSKKWYCHNEHCKQRIFTERFEHYI